MSITNPRLLLNPLPLPLRSCHEHGPESCAGYPDYTACVGVWIDASICTSDTECVWATGVCEKPCGRCVVDSACESVTCSPATTAIYIDGVACPQGDGREMGADEIK